MRSGSRKSIVMATQAQSAHGKHLMSLIHQATVLSAGRTTMELNVRQRLVVQRLGLGRDCSMAALAASLGYSPSTMTGLADRLESLGYAKRLADPNDRRATLLSLTAKGKRAFAQEVEFYRTLLDRIVTALPSKQKAPVLAAMERMDGAAGEEDAA